MKQSSILHVTNEECVQHTWRIFNFSLASSAICVNFKPDSFFHSTPLVRVCIKVKIVYSLFNHKLSYKNLSSEVMRDL